jgi:hypothetical protein
MTKPHSLIKNLVLIKVTAGGFQNPRRTGRATPQMAITHTSDSKVEPFTAECTPVTDKVNGRNAEADPIDNDFPAFGAAGIAVSLVHYIAQIHVLHTQMPRQLPQLGKATRGDIVRPFVFVAAEEAKDVERDVGPKLFNDPFDEL